MGFGVANIYQQPHINGTTIVDGAFRVHRGDQNVDSQSPTITGDQWRSLKTASGDATDFGDAVAAIGGSFQGWFLGLSVALREAFRASFSAV